MTHPSHCCCFPYTDGKSAYLSTISKEILAWIVSGSLEVEFVIETMRQLSRGTQL